MRSVTDAMTRSKRCIRCRLWWLLGILASVAVGLVVGETRGSDRINAYYGKLLQGIRGRHYWKNGRIFWVGEGYLQSSDEAGISYVPEGGLPKFWKGPTRFVSETILADHKNVYVKVDGRFHKVLSHFRCWYVCGSELRSGNLVIGEYGNRIYEVDAKTGQATLILEKPNKARHFHVTAVDPFTNDIYTSLGDALKEYVKLGDRVTGIMRSQDEGRTWNWLYKTTVGSSAVNRQPTAIYFDQDKIIFGTDCKPHGVFVLDRTTRTFEQVFAMPDRFRSWFTEIKRANGSYWALSRAFSNRGFGFLWWSGDGKAWTVVQEFKSTPVWLETDETSNVMSVGFLERDSDVIAFKIPAAADMAERASEGFMFTFTDLLQEKLFTRARTRAELR
jgi:hypothetical protein